MSPVLSDLCWAAGILLALGGCFPFARWFGRRRGMSPEASRKLIHIFMGVAVIGFPWIFRYRATVVVIGALATGVLCWLRVFASGEAQLGGALYRVNRLRSVGELVFPAAVVVCYLIAPSPEYYVTPILVLTFADSMAALVGTEYARMQLAAHRREAPKSFEGAIAFFFSAYLCISAPLLLFSALEKPPLLLVSLLLAVISAMLELVCPFGLDNFFVPFVIVMFLFHLSTYELGQLLTAALLLLIYTGIAVWVARRVNVTRLGIVYALLAVYLTTLLGGVFWVLAAFFQFLTYAVLPALTEEERAAPLNYHDVETNLIPSLAILFVGVFLHNPQLVFGVHTAYYACMTAKNHCLRLCNYHAAHPAAPAAQGFVRGVIVQLVPAGVLFWLAYGRPLSPLYWGMAGAAVFAELALSAAMLRQHRFPKISLRLGWICSLSSLALGGVLGAILYLTGGPAL